MTIKIWIFFLNLINIMDGLKLIIKFIIKKNNLHNRKLIQKNKIKSKKMLVMLHHYNILCLHWYQEEM